MTATAIAERDFSQAGSPGASTTDTPMHPECKAAAPIAARALVALRRAGQAKMISATYTHGEYDLVCVSGWPNEETATAFALALAAKGNVTVHTLRAFSPEEMAGIVKKMP